MKEKYINFFAQNKNIELELKENLKKYKELTTKRSMVKKQMKQLENKKPKKSKSKYYIKKINSQSLDLCNIKCEKEND